MNYYFVSADVALTLMVLQASGDFLPSDVQTYQYFIIVPETFTENLAENAKRLMIQIYDEHYEVFKIREPNDPNYIAVVDVKTNILNQAEYLEKPWLSTRPPVWENSHCILIQNNSYQKIDPNGFGAILGIA